MIGLLLLLGLGIPLVNSLEGELRKATRIVLPTYLLTKAAAARNTRSQGYHFPFPMESHVLGVNVG